MLEYELHMNRSPGMHQWYFINWITVCWWLWKLFFCIKMDYASIGKFLFSFNLCNWCLRIEYLRIGILFFLRKLSNFTFKSITQQSWHCCQGRSQSSVQMDRLSKGMVTKPMFSACRLEPPMAKIIPHIYTSKLSLRASVYNYLFYFSHWRLHDKEPLCHPTVIHSCKQLISTGSWDSKLGHRQTDSFENSHIFHVLFVMFAKPQSFLRVSFLPR